MTSLLLICLQPLAGSIVPHGDVGDPPLFILDVSLAKNEMECIYFSAVGQTTDIFIQTYFEQFDEILASAVDFLFIFSSMNTSTSTPSSTSFSSPPLPASLMAEYGTPHSSQGECYLQGGYNSYPISNCLRLDSWNASWNAQYDILVQDDIVFPSSNEEDGGGRFWKFCVANGWAGSETAIRYQSLVVMFGLEYSDLINITTTRFTTAPTYTPTTAPTLQPTLEPESEEVSYPLSDTVTFLSACNEPISIHFDVTLPAIGTAATSGTSSAGEWRSCQTVYGTTEKLQSIQLSYLNYTLHSPSQLSPRDINQGLSDLALTLVNTQTHHGIQIGGVRYLSEFIEAPPLPWSSAFDTLDLTYTSHDTTLLTITLPQDDSRYDLRILTDTSAETGAVVATGTVTVGSVLDTNGIGQYELCLYNSYSGQTSTLVTYDTLITLPDLNTLCDVTIQTTSPTSPPTLSPTLSPPISFPLYHSQGNNSLLLTLPLLTLQHDTVECTDLFIGGILTSIEYQLTYEGNGLNWASDLLFSFEEYNSSTQLTSDPTISCLQIEGSTSGYQLPNCRKLAYWPGELNQVKSGLYVGIFEPDHLIEFDGYTLRQVQLSDVLPPSPLSHLSVSLSLSLRSASPVLSTLNRQQRQFHSTEPSA
jgi:hypothetical protein